jgi:hypothetical protein
MKDSRRRLKDESSRRSGRRVEGRVVWYRRDGRGWNERVEKDSRRRLKELRRILEEG